MEAVRLSLQEKKRESSAGLLLEDSIADVALSFRFTAVEIKGLVVSSRDL